MSRLSAPAGIGLALGLIAAACTGDDPSEPTSAVVTTTTEPPAPRVDDGVLRIGALIPTSDTGVGVALEESFRSAIEAVNNAGGVLGNDVELVIADEGTTIESAALAVVDELVAADVDAVIGPTSSNTAIGALDAAVSNGLMMCSATAGAITLDDFPDDGLFFRSVATDSLQAVAIAQQAQLTGASNIAIVHTADSYGRPYAAAIAAELGFAELTVIDVAVDTVDYDAEIDELNASSAPVAIVIGSGDDTAAFLTAVGNSDMADLTDIIVNDAALNIDAQDMSELPDSVRQMILGVVPQIILPPPPVDDPPVQLPFAAQVADCVTLIALAALQAKSDAPAVIATQMSSVSSGGSVCRTFEECAMRLDEGRQIDYNGPTGITELGRNGDPSRARFDLFEFDDEGVDRSPESGSQQFVADFDRG